MPFKKENHNVAHCAEKEGRLSSALKSESVTLDNGRITNGTLEGSSYMNGVL